MCVCLCVCVCVCVCVSAACVFFHACICITYSGQEKPCTCDTHIHTQQFPTQEIKPSKHTNFSLWHIGGPIRRISSEVGTALPESALVTRLKAASNVIASRRHHEAFAWHVRTGSSADDAIIVVWALGKAHLYRLGVMELSEGHSLLGIPCLFHTFDAFNLLVTYDASPWCSALREEGPRPV